MTTTSVEITTGLCLLDRAATRGNQGARRALLHGPAALLSPPRARSVTSGVADPVGYAPAFFDAWISRRARAESREPFTQLTGSPGIPAINTQRRNKMNWDRIEGNWTEFKGKAQQQWGKLTNDDLDVVEGKRKELAGRLQQRYGYAKDQAEKEIDTWLNSIH
jgi:uncharacterized protein YjbJ (UPF0337 family)